jgi:hypothetical protein
MSNHNWFERTLCQGTSRDSIGFNLWCAVHALQFMLWIWCEPTAVKREMTEKITEPGQTGTNPEEAAEIARKKGMTKGTAGAAGTGSEYEQGAAGSNK